MNDYPFHKYKKNDILNEYNKLKMKLEEYDASELKEIDECSFYLPRTKIGNKCSNYFFEKIRLQTPTMLHPSNVDFWNENKKKILKFYNSQTGDKKYSLESILKFRNRPPLQYSVLISGQIYKMFNSKKIIDPYAGWGDRCLSSIALGIHYTGIDSNKKLEPCYDKMIKFFDAQNVNMYFDKSENVIKKINTKYDLCFTSPPFFNEHGKAIEKYENMEQDYTTFMNSSLIPVFRKCLKICRWICMYIPQNMYEKLEDKFGSCTLKIYFGSQTTWALKKTQKDKIIYCWKC